jgi:2-polyprenyl-6-methoxyphenol hydroxylase-like FAD-dependent oxidoreductase
MPNSLAGNVAIVGGSLAGLATAIGLARQGLPVNVFEQNAGEERGGSGLGVELALITRTTGVDARVDGLTHALPVVNEGQRDTSTWLAIYRWLRAVADRTDGLSVHESARVDVISCDDRTAYLSGPRVKASADVIIGADGYRSVVRRAVSPARPFAPYGGFLIWRALVEEAWLPARLLDQRSLGGGRSPHPETARLVVYRVPGPNGETSRGERSITLAWYDASRTQWLRDRGYLVGEEVLGSIPPTAIDDDLRAELLALAARRWHGAARDIITSAIERKVIFGTPLAEYLPERLVAGRLGIVGDAAHVASPMVGAGFSSGLLDGATFIQAVIRSGGTVAEAGARALQRYNETRLTPNRSRVLESLAATRELLLSTRSR